jgi:hypothetical protein
MARVDSGHETLFSDDSPCELGTTPSACSSSGLGSASSGNNQPNPEDADTSRVGPPKITPYSGVLTKASHPPCPPLTVHSSDVKVKLSVTN